MTQRDRDELPIAVIGAGPVGMAAAAELLVRGDRPVVFESGEAVGSAMREWAHVQVFSPWRYCLDPAARTILEATGWNEPPLDQLPTGAQILERYLDPLASAPEFTGRIRLNTRVAGVARHGFDKLKTAGRDAAPFELILETPEGEERFLARAVIDASGTWSSPNHLGSNGLPAVGELEAKEHIAYGIPDILGSDRVRYAGRRTLVVGSGHSAFNALLDLVELMDRDSATEVSWAIRRDDPGQMFGGGEADALPARGELGAMVLALIQTGRVKLVTGFATTAVRRSATGLAVSSRETELGPFDEIIGATGFKPDLRLTSELRLELDPIVEAPRALAPLIDPNLHSCGTVPPHGARELAHPETGYYAVGMKSYGRAPTFLMLTGYEQVRSIAAELTGDPEGARQVELTLPETGVCSSQPAFVHLSGGRLNVLQPPTAEGCCG